MRVDEIVEVTLARRKDLALGISTLFAALDAKGKGDWKGTELAVSDIEFEQSIKLDFEREMLGTYVSDHPLYGVMDVLATKTEGSIVAVRERAEEFSLSSRPVTVGGFSPKCRSARPRPTSRTRASSSKTSAVHSK